MWGWGKLSKIPLKGVKQNRGDGTQNLKKEGGQAGSRGGCRKKEVRVEPPYELCVHNGTSFSSISEC